MKKFLSVLYVLSCVVSLAADFFVDSNAAIDSATGTQTAPFVTIKAAVDAANAQFAQDGIPSTIFVKGGESCSYTIATADDLIIVTASNLTVKAWADFGAPKIYLDKDLSSNTNNPSVIQVKKEADEFSITGFEFYSYCDNERKHSGTSLGQSGILINIFAKYCVVDSCKFYQDNPSNNGGWGGSGIFASNDRGETSGMTVKNCYFKNFGGRDSQVIKSPNQVRIISNIFENTTRCYKAMQYIYGGQFISNRIINVTKPLYSNGDNYREDQDIEIAYNIFVNDGDIPFINKSNVGFDQAKIHHNTFVGNASFVTTRGGNSVFTWTPNFYNNLIIVNGELGTIINEYSSDVGQTNPTTFATGSKFVDNVWMAPDFNGGSAVQDLEQYNLVTENPDSAGLFTDNNLRLSQVPEFIETEDIFSENFYRLNSLRYSWADGLNSSYGTEPAYIGAQEPIAYEGEPGEFFTLTSFSVSSEAFTPGSEIEFKVEYSLNAGPVTVKIDYDGDGIYDYAGNDTVIKYTYTAPGTYIPSIMLIDTATSKELVATLAIPELEILSYNVYVDALAAAGGNGTEANPCRTITEATKICAENGTIFVRGGDDRVYEINSADDFIYIERNFTTIKSWGDYGNAKVVVSHTLNKATPNPYIVNVDLNAYGVTISELDFVWYGEKNETYPGNSIGTGGRIINANGKLLTVKNCRFRLDGAYNESNKAYAIKSNAWQEDKAPGQFLRVEGCTFEGITGEEKQLYTVWTGMDPVLINNVYTNCYLMFAPLKGYGGTFTFSSNAMYECRTIQSNNPEGNWNEIPNAEISYNKFVTSTGEPFITKTRDGLADNVSIHHNTVVGSSSFILTTIPNSDEASWYPKIYDNLIILAENGTMFIDNSPKKNRTYSCYFRPETVFKNNVYMSSNWFDGTAKDIEGYEFTLAPTDCVQLDVSPRFMSTEIGNENEYRVRATKLDWAFASSVGGYPNYVGAVEPFLAPLSTLIIIR